jgi:parallel beta-helix repeat protein
MSRLKGSLVLVLAFLLLLAVFGAVLKVPLVRGSGTIYIRANGSVEGTTSIVSSNNVTYVFTADINDLIVVERSNIVIDGKGYALEFAGPYNGLSLYSVSNVTIKNINIGYFYYDIVLSGSSNNSIIGNNITQNNQAGIYLYASSYNNISGNNITASVQAGIWIHSSFYNSISENNIKNNERGIYSNYGSSCNITGNNIANNFYGVYLYYSSNHKFYHNNFAGNDRQVYDYYWDHSFIDPSINTWDNGSEGNYWSNYTGVDNNGDGIGDTPHIIDTNNQDNHPLMKPFSSVSIPQSPSPTPSPTSSSSSTSSSTSSSSPQASSPSPSPTAPPGSTYTAPSPSPSSSQPSPSPEPDNNPISPITLAIISVGIVAAVATSAVIFKKRRS